MTNWYTNYTKNMQKYTNKYTSKYASVQNSFFVDGKYELGRMSLISSCVHHAAIYRRSSTFSMHR